MRLGNEVIFLMALQVIFFKLFLRFWDPKPSKMELRAPSQSNFLHSGGNCVFERPYMDLACLSVSGGLAERLLS